MAATSASSPVPIAPPKGRSTGLARIFVPGMGDLFFVALICWLFIAGVGWQRLMFDGDTGVHIRIGDRVLSEWAFPVTDTFAFSMPGKPWIAWEWLSGVLFSAFHTWFGLQGVAAITGIVLAGTLTLLLRYMIWKGVSWLVALPLMFSAATAMYLTFMARPHIFTNLFLILFVWMVDADRRRGASGESNPRLWLLVPMTALWANLHGGFVILAPYLGILVLGLLAEGWFWSEQRSLRWSQARRYGLLGVACTAITAINPYGLRLHAQIYENLAASWIRDYAKEFQSPNFRNEYDMHVMLLLFLGLAAATLLVQGRRLADAAWIVFLSYAMLTSTRHSTLLVLVAVPYVGEVLSEAWIEWASRQPRKSAAAAFYALGLEKQAAFGHNSIWAVAMAACLFLPLQLGQWPTDIKPELVPAKLIARNKERLVASRVFSDDELADYLIYKNYPHQKVFMDGRANYFGRGVEDDFRGIIGGGSKWRGLVERYRIDTMLLDRHSALAVQLDSDPSWKQLDREGEYGLYERRELRSSR